MPQIGSRREYLEICEECENYAVRNKYEYKVPGTKRFRICGPEVQGLESRFAILR
jgi:hypothetical protein